MPLIKRNKPKKERVTWWMSRELFDKLGRRAERHIPQPTKSDFFCYILKLAIEAYEGGRRDVDQSYYFEGNEYQPNYDLEVPLIEKIETLWAVHEPSVTISRFAAYLYMLGLQKYESIYNQYGFIDED